MAENEISNGVQMEWNLRERDFLNKHDTGDLEAVKKQGRKARGRGRAYPLGAPSTLVGPPLLHWRTSSSYIYPRTPPQNIQEHHENLIPPSQPSVLERSHLGAFFGAPPEGALFTEGLYINSVASLVMCE